MIYLIYSDIPKFILKRIFKKLIGGKLGLSQRIKTKQVFIVFDWKEDASIEEERKVIATRFMISSLFHTLIVSFHPSQQAIVPGVAN